MIGDRADLDGGSHFKKKRKGIKASGRIEAGHGQAHPPAAPSRSSAPRVAAEAGGENRMSESPRAVHLVQARSVLRVPGPRPLRVRSHCKSPGPMNPLVRAR